MPNESPALRLGSRSCANDTDFTPKGDVFADGQNGRMFSVLGRMHDTGINHEGADAIAALAKLEMHGTKGPRRLL
jgi:hypothetical protein